MRFEILSHAALDIESGARLLVDPWLRGSCYWDSWWHFPEAAPLDRPLAAGDFVYLTHGHEDHLHEATLRDFDRRVTVLLPKLPLRYLRDAIDGLGFRDVVEIPHGDTLALGDALRVTSYQTGWVNDSALVVEGGEHVLGNFNDALFVEPVLRALSDRHGPFDFVLKSHSSASAYPHCFESPDPEDLALYDEAEFIGNFFHYARALRARYAVPFASNVCFLHPETRALNRHVISPLRIAEEHARQPAGTPEVAVMLPGDRWSAEAGFETGDAGARLASLDEEVERMARERAAVLDARAQREAARTLRFERFQAYFEGMCRALPRPVRWGWPLRIAFEVPGDPAPWWVVDLGRARVERVADAPSNVSATLRVAPGLLDDALEHGVFGFVDISKRIHVSLEAGGIFRYAIFKELVGLYEAGYFPILRNLLRRRFVGAWWRRRRELASYAKALLRGPKALVPSPPPAAVASGSSSHSRSGEPAQGRARSQESRSG